MNRTELGEEHGSAVLRGQSTEDLWDPWHELAVTEAATAFLAEHPDIQAASDALHAAFVKSNEVLIEELEGAGFDELAQRLRDFEEKREQ